MPLSLCMIVKNEENNLEKSIQSVAHIVDEIIVVDTGSIDSTRVKARALGARVFKYTWRDNFSGARNFSLSKATKDWVMILDADEYMQVDPKSIAKALTDKTTDAYGIPWRHIHFPKSFVRNYKTNLFRNKIGLKFVGSVHEEIFQAVKPARWKILKAELIHAVRGNDLNKIDYYISLLEKEPDDIREGAKAQYWLGLHHLQKNFHTHAKFHFMKSLEKQDRPFFSVLSGLHLLRSSMPNPRETEIIYFKCRKLIERYSDDGEISIHPEISTYLKSFSKLFPDYNKSYFELEKFFVDNQ